MIEINIGEEQQEQRLDRFLKKYLPQASLGHIYKIIRIKVKVNGKKAKPEQYLKMGDVLALYLPEDVLEGFLRPEQEPRRTKGGRRFSVVYEDENLLLVNKPRGLLTHGDQTEKKNTLVNQVLDYLVETGAYRFSRTGTFVPAPVNRLDRNTSGLVIFGKNNLALQCLNRMIRSKESIGKFYLAAAKGELMEEKVLRSVMEKDHDKNRIRILEEGSADGRIMETILRPISCKNGYSLVEAQLVTGRTHQIRAHMASEGLPILGDPKYGRPGVNKEMKERFGLKGQFLHAWRLTFQDCPEMFGYLNGKEFTAPLPAGLEKIRKELFEE